MSKSRKFSPEFKQGATEQVRQLDANLLSRRKRETKTGKPSDDESATANAIWLKTPRPDASGIRIWADRSRFLKNGQNRGYWTVVSRDLSQIFLVRDGNQTLTRFP